MDDDVGKQIKVKVSFTDDAGDAEGPLVSLPTEAVVAADVLVQNTGKTPATGTNAALNSFISAFGQRFTTGSYAAGYALSSIGVPFTEIGDTSTVGTELTVTLNAESSGLPGSALCTLSAPATFNASGLHAFDAPTTDPCPTLAPETTYFVVLSRANNNTDAIKWAVTSTLGEDSGSALGWSIGDRAHEYTDASSTWAQLSTDANLIIEVKGANANRPATGAPSIQGFLEDGEELTADTVGIADADGLGAFSYQWLAGGTAISGATSATYTLTATEVGDAISLTVTFTDGEGFSESLTSAATYAVVASGATHKLLWLGTMEVGSVPSDQLFGYSDVESVSRHGSLSVTKLSVAGTEYTIQGLRYGRLTDDTLLLFLSPAFPGPFTLHVGSVDTEFASQGAGERVRSGFQIYFWFNPYPGWSDGQKVTLFLQEKLGVILTPSTLTVDEGGTADYTVQLSSEPTAGVTVDITGGGDVTVNPTSLTFTTTTWDTAQTVMVTAAQDDDGADDTLTVGHAVAHGSADEYVGASLDGLAVTVTDDEIPGVTLTPTTLTVNEGSTADYTVELRVQPTADVTIDITGGGDVTVNPTSLTFTSATWNTAKTVMVTAAQDMDAVDDTQTVTHAVATGSADEYTGVTVDGLDVTVDDDERLGIRLTPTALTVNEGSTADYTVELRVQPTANVTINITGGGDVTVNPTSLTFTTSTWDTAQTVMVTATQDDDAADDAQTVTHAVASGSATEYLGVSLDGLAVTVDDSATEVTVPADWALIPTGLTGGDKFRLVFITASGHSPTSTDIADYNTYVQGQAALGHTDIQDYSYWFRVVGSTAGTDARDNTETTYTATERGVPIYWLNGIKVVDDYGDFYDGGWDDEVNPRNRAGATITVGPVWTGSNGDGTEAFTTSQSRAFGAAVGLVRTGRLNHSSGGPLNTGLSVAPTNNYPYYALSGVFVVAAANTQPAFSADSATRTLPENSGAGVDVVGGVITATDSDSGDTLTYSLTGTDAGSFEIDSNGQLKTKIGVTHDFNFEAAKKSYSVTVNVRDSKDADENADTVTDDTIAVTIDLTNVNEAPEITTTATTASVAENSTAVLTLAASDVDASDTKTWSVESAGDGGKFTITSSGALSFTNAPNFEMPTEVGDTAGNNTYVVTVKVADAGGLTDTHTVTVTVTNVDEAGTVTLPATFVRGTAATASVSDPDGGIIVSIWRWARGDSATGSFSNITGAASDTYTPVAADVGKYLRATVTYKDAESATVKTASAVSSSAVGGSNTQPAFSADDATRTLPENSGAGVDVVGGVITATDSDSGDTLTYSLTGTDAGSFEIDSNGQLKTKIGVTHDFNFEAAKKSYSVTVNVRDSKDADGNADTVTDDTIAVTIDLTNVNEAPEITTTATTASVAENSTAVLTLAASDVDASDTKTWSVESAGDGGKFTITSSGALSFTNAPNFEMPTDVGDTAMNNTYVVTVKVTDGGGLTDTHTVTVTVTNVDEAGTVTLPATFVRGTAATASVSDPDGTVSGDSWKWARGNTRTGSFSDITGATSATYTPVAADAGKYLRATVTYKDPESTTVDKTASAVSSGTVGGSNTQPAFSADDATRTLPENSGAGVDVVGGVVTATDSDSGDTLTYSLTGTDAGSFEIDSNGQLKTKTGVTHDFNFEAAKKSYSVTVNVRDSKDADGNADTVVDDTIAVTINLTNVNEAPEITTTATTASVAENTTAVLTLAASDVDASDTKTWSVESTGDGGKFTITSSGALSFSNAPNFEMPTDVGDTAMNNTYVVTVKVTDDGSPAMSDTHTFTVTVTNVNEAPVFTSPPATADFAENGTGTVVDFDATDVDASTTLTFSVSPTLDSGKFDINSTTGVLTFKNPPDFETPTDVDVHDGAMNNTYAVTVHVRDNGSPREQDGHVVIVTVTDVNEPPTITTTATTASVAENSTAVLTFAASDVDASDTKTWSVESTDDGGKFTITSSGALSFSNAPNFEMPTDVGDTAMNNTYVVTVKVTDGGGLTDTHTVTVTVTNVDEAGTVTLPATFVRGTAATASVSDPDGTVSGDSWQWAKGNTRTGSFSDITGATSATYTPVAADVGKYLRATVTYKDPQSTTVDKTASAVSSGTVGGSNTQPPPSVSITASVTEPVTAPFRVTITFTDRDGNELDATGFEADEIIAYYTKRGQETYEFQITDFREETPGRVYSALVDKIVDGKLWVEVEEDSAQSSQDGQGNTLAYESWQVDAPDPGPAPNGTEIYTDTLTVGGQYPDGYGLDGKDTGTKGYFKGWSPASTNDVRYGALPGANFTYRDTDYEVLDLSYTGGWRVVRLSMCPFLQGASSRTVLRFGSGSGSDWMTFGGDNFSTGNFSRTKDGGRQQCREYEWDQTTLDWEYGDSVSVKILTRAGGSQGRSAGSVNPNQPAAGAPAITGTAQVNQELTADTSGITDKDGLKRVSYRYQWIAMDGAEQTSIEDATASTYTPAPSDVGKTIRVRVWFTDDARNRESRSSGPTTAVLPAVPTEPLQLTVTPGSQDEELDAAWQPPASNGGSDVTGYKVQWKEAADSWDTAADVSEETVTGTTHTITGLTGGVEYAVRVIATNVAGDGPASTQAAETPAGGTSQQDGPEPPPQEEEQEQTGDDQQTPQSPPPAPTSLTATVNADGHIVLSWTAPNDDSITGYQVLRRRPTQGETTLLEYVADTQSTATTFTDTGVTAGVKHVYRVKAINAAGLSGWSNYVNPTP